MNRAVVVVPEHPAGWGSGRMTPLVGNEECRTIAALTAAGCVVDVVGEKEFLGEAGAREELVILSRPGPGMRARIEDRLSGGGGRLLIANDRLAQGSVRSGPFHRSLNGPSSRLEVELALSPRHARPRGARRLLLLVRPYTALSPENGEEVLARWGSSGPAALTLRRGSGLTRWRSGFPLDHLSASGWGPMKEILNGDGADGSSVSPAVPGGARAVVLLFHDVEAPLSGDPRGVESVIAGIDACLEAEKREGFTATYNLVGKFCEGIPGSVRRIDEEGHDLASHGATHRVVADLDPEGLRQEVAGAEESIAQICGRRIEGFRSPRSRWSDPLLDCLAERGYRWNAEADASLFPYRVPRETAGSLLRIPLTIDDWDLVSRRSSPRSLLAAWKREVRWAMERSCWVGVGSHPSVLGAEPDRMAAYSDFLAWLGSEDVAVMDHASAVAWWGDRSSGSVGSRSGSIAALRRGAS